MTSTTDLARQLGFVAADLEKRQYPFAGVVRIGARVLLDVPGSSDSGCRGCGADLPTRQTGRPRVWAASLAADGIAPDRPEMAANGWVQSG